MSEALDGTSRVPLDPEARGPRAIQILEAAESLLLEFGYEGLSAKAVADKAGVNKALIFYYWGSTTVLFERVLERYYIRHKKILFSVLHGEGELKARVHGIVDALFDSVERDPLYPRLVQQQVSGNGPHVHLVRKHYADIQSHLESALAELSWLEGSQAIRHFHLSFSAVIINFFTYGESFDFDLKTDLAGRRAHVHWLVDAWLIAVEREALEANTAKN